MAVKFSQFNVGATVSDIDYIVGYKSTDNVQIPIGLVTANTTYTVATAQSGLNETLTLTGSDASTDVITFTAGANITLTDDGVGNGFTIQAKGNVDGTGTANSITKWADADTITDSIMSETAAGGQFTDPYITVAGAGGGVSTQNLEINGFLLDSNGQKGTAGQILSSTGTLTDWITPAAGETYDLNSTTDGANVDLNLTSTSGTDNSSVKLVPATGISIAQVADVVTITNTAPGDTYSLAAGVKAGSSVPLNLNAVTGSNSVVNLTEGTGITLTQTSATEITIDAANNGTVTEVSSADTNLITVANGTTTPALTAVTGAVSPTSTSLATGAQIQTAINAATGGIGVSVISSDTSAVSANLYVFTANLTLTLPTSPTVGNFIKVSNRSGVATCVVARNNENIMGSATDLTVNNLNAGFEMIYTGATQGWVLIGVEGTT